MAKKIIVNEPICSREELTYYAQKYGLNLDSYLKVAHDYMTYICLHEPSMKLKIGKSYSPSKRAINFGRLTGVVFDVKLEQLILNHFGRCTPPDTVYEKSTEWIDVSLEETFNYILELGYDVMELTNHVQKSYKLQSISKRPLYPINVKLDTKINPN